MKIIFKKSKFKKDDKVIMLHPYRDTYLGKELLKMIEEPFIVEKATPQGIYFKYFEIPEGWTKYLDDNMFILAKYEEDCE